MNPFYYECKASIKKNHRNQAFPVTILPNGPLNAAAIVVDQSASPKQGGRK